MGLPPNKDAKKPQRAQHRLLELDVMRGLAALAVLACHYVSECQAIGRLGFDFRYGSYGPHLFFMISGFVILMTLERSRQPADFAFSRFSRLYPVYWTGVAMSVLVIGLAPQSFSTVPSLTDYLGNLTMCQTWLGIPDIEVSYWTLGVELKFYGLAFILLLLRKQHQIEYSVVAWLTMVLLYRCIDHLIGLPHFVATPLIIDYAHLFAAGAMFYRIRVVGHSHLRHALIWSAVPMSFWAEGTEAMVFCILFVLLFYAFHANRLKWIICRPLTLLGSISYALYLIHGSLGVACIHWLDTQQAPVWMLLIVPTIVSIALAGVLTFQFERPTLRRLRTWYRQERRAVTASAQLAGE